MRDAKTTTGDMKSNAGIALRGTTRGLLDWAAQRAGKSRSQLAEEIILAALTPKPGECEKCRYRSPATGDCSMLAGMMGIAPCERQAKEDGNE